MLGFPEAVQQKKANIYNTAQRILLLTVQSELERVGRDEVINLCQNLKKKPQLSYII